MPFFFLYPCVLFPRMFVNLRRCWWRIGHGMSLTYSGLWLYDQSFTLFSLLFLYVTIGVMVWHWHLSWGRGHFGVLWWFYSEFNEVSLLTNDLRRSLFLVSCFKWHSTKKTFDRANLGTVGYSSCTFNLCEAKTKQWVPREHQIPSTESPVCLNGRSVTLLH